MIEKLTISWADKIKEGATKRSTWPMINGATMVIDNFENTDR